MQEYDAEAEDEIQIAADHRAVFELWQDHLALDTQCWRKTNSGGQQHGDREGRYVGG
jgi:hypothetical protein